MQLGGTPLNFEKRLTTAFLDAAARIPGATVGLATAYCNPPADLLAKLAKVRVDIVAPSIPAHGFDGARDIRRNVPIAYQLIARDIAAVIGSNHLHEWSSDNDDSRTFHAKGAWLHLPSNRVIATLIGSSNFNVRARRRDFELTYLLATSQFRLQRHLTNEWIHFRRFASFPTTLLSPDARPPYWVLLFRPFINTFL